ncbi:MAG: hypothetical protein GZ091_08015 [Paludibacter sp.]|nr:hypothetical protein [Paludibacter sp.]
MIKKYLQKFSAVFLSAFGLITLFLTLSIFLNLFGIREKEGNYVLFVVIANFVCSLLYLFAGIGFWTQKIWTSEVLIFSTVILLITFIAFNIYASNGGLHEQKTYGALIFRTSITFAFSIIAYFSIKKST